MRTFTPKKSVIVTARWIALVIVVAGAALLIYRVADYMSEEKLLFWSTGSRDKAFLNATWEMSPPEIRRANHAVRLSEPQIIDWLTIPVDSDFPPVTNMSRYKSLEQQDLTIWGEAASVEYGFFDDRLLTYTLSFKPYSLERLRDTILAEVTQRFGKFTAGGDGRDQLSGTWDGDKVSVSMWTWLEKGDPPTHGIGLRFTYKPLFAKVKQISEQEKHNIF